MQIFHLKSCDTCRRAIKALSERDPQLTDVRADGVPADMLATWLERVGPDLLINRKSTTWRNLTEIERAGDPLQLLLDNPTLMKRPVVLEGDNIYVGWTNDVQAELNVS